MPGLRNRALALSAALVAVLSAAALTGCAPVSAEPTIQASSPASASYTWPRDLTMFDNTGERVGQTLTADPKRVVVIGQNLAELMIAFGVQDRIVGIGYLDGADSYYKDELDRLPKLSDQVPSAEAVLALEPDLILSMSFAMTEESMGTIKTWNDRGIPVLTADNYTIGRDLQSYFTDIQNLGAAFDVSAETDAYIAQEKQTLDEIRAVAATATSRPNVLLVASGGSNKLTYNYYSPSLGLVDEMVDAAGGTYVEVSEEVYAEMSSESIIKANPDVIVMTQFQKSSAEAEKDKLIHDQRLASVTAVSSGQVMLLDYATVVRGTPHLGELTRQLAVFLHPELDFS
ncbi:MAG: ABC transporter substrate-binding protein [Microbacterium sp.]|jgi:iron complex transport system substrate-binding protein|nr:ABC transporter substrate-binding protein [Microbacterium sp.]